MSNEKLFFTCLEWKISAKNIATLYYWLTNVKQRQDLIQALIQIYLNSAIA